MSKTYALKFIQEIPCTIDEAWRFFSDPANLVKITPTAFDFRVISKYHGDTIYPGQIIEYKVRPLWNIPFYWMTEITKVKEKEYFIDEQRFGPYRLWHHQHHFREMEGGVEMTDIVHYKNPLWIAGLMANNLFVKKRLKGIFKYRYKRVEEIFGKWPGGQEMQIEIH